MTTVAIIVVNAAVCKYQNNLILIMNLYPNLIKEALQTVRYPGTGKNLVEADMIADNMRIDGMSVSFSIIFEKLTLVLFLSKEILLNKNINIFFNSDK